MTDWLTAVTERKPQRNADDTRSHTVALTFIERDQLVKLAREAEDRAETAERDAERWQVRCAGCLTAAEGHTANPANEGDYGWTLAYQRTVELRRACSSRCLPGGRWNRRGRPRPPPPPKVDGNPPYDVLRARLTALAERWDALGAEALRAGNTSSDTRGGTLNDCAAELRQAIREEDT